MKSNQHMSQWPRYHIKYRHVSSCNVAPNITVKPIEKAGRPLLLTKTNSEKELTVIQTTDFTLKRHTHLPTVFGRKNIEIFANSSLIYSKDIRIFLYFSRTFFVFFLTKYMLQNYQQTKQLIINK